jgi:hypothetical protein
MPPLPNPPVSNLLNRILDYLVAQGIVRSPMTAPPAPPGVNLPPLWKDPPTPYFPGDLADQSPTQDHPDCVVSMIRVAGIPHREMEGFIRRLNVDFHLRTKTGMRAYQFEEQLYAALADKTNFFMGDLRVNKCNQARDLQPLGKHPKGHAFVTELEFWIWGTAPGETP